MMTSSTAAGYHCHHHNLSQCHTCAVCSQKPNSVSFRCFCNPFSIRIYFLPVPKNSQQTRVSLQFHYECITDLLAVCLVHRVLLSECVKVSSYHIIHSFIHLSNQAANHSSFHLPIHPNKPFTTIQIHSIHC